METSGHLEFALHLQMHTQMRLPSAEINRAGCWRLPWPSVSSSKHRTARWPATNGDAAANGADPLGSASRRTAPRVRRQSRCRKRRRCTWPEPVRDRPVTSRDLQFDARVPHPYAQVPVCLEVCDGQPFACLSPRQPNPHLQRERHDLRGGGHAEPLTHRTTDPSNHWPTGACPRYKLGRHWFICWEG